MPTPEETAEIERYRQTYRDMLGFVPPRVGSRLDALSESNPELLLAQERVRNLIVYNEVLDQRTTQLVLFGVLAVQLRDAAKLHGLAALRAGASYQELQAVLDLAYLFGGLSVANHAPSILAEVAELEEKSKQESGQ